MPRLFTGLEVASEMREGLARLKSPLPGARWVDPQNFHVTLRFIGDVDNGTAREVAASLREIDLDPFEMRLEGLGTFGGRTPRALWAGVEGGEPLEALARANERAVRNAGLAPEGRAFKPHVTLAYLQHSRDETLARFLQRNGGFRAGPAFVVRFVLFSAKPQTGGGPYVIEETYPLGGLGEGYDEPEREPAW